MLGQESRGTTIKEGNAAAVRMLDNRQMRRCRSQAGACAARRADAAHRCGVRRIFRIAAWRIIKVAVAVLVRMRGGATAVLPFAQRHQHAGIAAQRQGREEQGEQNDPAGAFHGENPITGILH